MASIETKNIAATPTTSPVDQDLSHLSIISSSFSKLRACFGGHPLNEKDLAYAKTIAEELAGEFRVPLPQVKLKVSSGIAYFCNKSNAITICSECSREEIRRYVHHEMVHAAQAKLVAAYIIAYPDEAPKVTFHPDIAAAAIEQGLHLNETAVRCGRRIAESKLKIRELSKKVDQSLDPDDSDCYIRFYNASFIELGPTIEDRSIAQEEALKTLTTLRKQNEELTATAGFHPILAIYKLYTSYQLKHYSKLLGRIEKDLNALLSSLGRRYEQGKFDPEM